MKTIDYNSTVNQNIKQKFVEREVYLCLSSWVDDYQKNNECWFDEFENLYLTDEQILNDCYSHSYDTNEEYIEEVRNNGDDMQEPLEYWAVSEYLYEKLKEKGEPVAYINNTYIWGRTCSGQAILLDCVISDICVEMEILEGQKYSWE